MALHELERRHKQRQQADPARDHELELSRALDDQRVMTFDQWCQVNGFSFWTGKRLILAGKGPIITQLSPRRIGITVANNRAWQQSRERG